MKCLVKVIEMSNSQENFQPKHTVYWQKNKNIQSGLENWYP